MPRLCIVGCGLTGAVTASLLKQKLPHLQVVILEKSKGTGGRFGTSRSPFGSSVDLGAQFVTKTSSLSDVQKKCYSKLLETGLLQPLRETVEGLKDNEGAENFVCSQGSGSIVKHFLQSAGCEILFSQRVTKLSVDGSKWKLSCGNSDFEFDAIILTIPVPQVLQLDGITSYIQDKELQNMKSVVYTSRFAFGLFYDFHTDYFHSMPWVSKYIPNDSVLRFCSIDHRKRSVHDLPSVAVHTTKEFGKIHVEEDSSTVQSTILNSLTKVFPHLPKPSFIKNHKWRYSQVEKSYVDKPGCIVLLSNPLLISGGDGYSSSTFEGCIYSSESILKHIVENCDF